MIGTDDIEYRKMIRKDMESFLLLVKQVEPLFGPMAGEYAFEGAILQAVDSGCCICGVDGQGVNVGAVIIDRERNEICWLAVSGDRRGYGIGRTLLDEAMKQMDTTRPILVQTFAEGIEIGASARKLYQAHRFVDQQTGGRNPAGYDTVWMTRPADL